MVCSPTPQQKRVAAPGLTRLTPVGSMAYSRLRLDMRALADALQTNTALTDLQRAGRAGFEPRSVWLLACTGNISQSCQSHRL